MFKTFFLACLLLACASGLAQSYDRAAELPRSEPNVALPSLAGFVKQTVCASGCDYTSANLQSALNVAAADTTHGRIVELKSGESFSAGTYLTVPARACGLPLIVVRSSAFGDTPWKTAGTRVTPGDAPHMAKITNTNYGAIFRAFDNAKVCGYRFIGLELADSNTGTSNDTQNIVELSADNSTYNNQAAETENITFDRNYIHGSSGGNLVRAFYFVCKTCAVIDSWISEVHSTLQQNQGIMYAGSGGQLFQNNHIESAGTGIGSSGGGFPFGITPEDITLRGNHLYKPERWNPRDATYDASHDWKVLGHIEMKNSRRILVENNILQNSFLDATPEQSSAWGLLLKGDYFAPTALETRDVTVRFNSVQRVGGAFYLVGRNSTGGHQDSPGDYARVYQISVHDNLFTLDPAWTGGDSYRLYNLYGGDFLSFRHNTFIGAAGYLIRSIFLVYPTSHFEFADNIAEQGAGIIGAGNSSGDAGGAAGLDAYYRNCGSQYWALFDFLNKNCAIDYTFAKNGIIGASYGGNLSAGSTAAAGFMNYTGDASGDYRLSVASPFHNAASDGKDIGADVEILNARTANVVSGAGTLQSLGAIMLSPSSLSLTVGGAGGSLTASCLDTNSAAMSCPALTWWSDATLIATVSAGTVSPIGSGSTLVTASASGVTSNAITVTVTSVTSSRGLKLVTPRRLFGGRIR